MASNERQNPPRLGAGVLDDDITPAGGIGDMGNDEGSAAGRGAEGEEHVEDVAGDEILLRDEIRRVVLDETGFADELGEEGDEGVAVEGAEEGGEGSHRRR